MSHDEHFLLRLERLDPQQVELALRLYHDHGLVGHVLRQSNVPESADRIALSLDHDEEGPFLIVTREGRFVTCLARGMKHDLPVVTFHKLESLAAKMESLRVLVTEAKRDDYRETGRLFRRVDEAGDAFTREDFEELSHWVPLLASQFFDAMIDRAALAGRIIEALPTAKRLKRRHDPILHEYWNKSWAIAHFALLLGSDNGEALSAVLAAAARRRPLPRVSSLFPWVLSRFGVSSFAARGAWAASKFPKLLFADLKDAWTETPTFDTAVAYGIGLSAIGLRHGHRQAEVGKVLRRRQAPSVLEGCSPEWIAFVTRLREMIAMFYEAGTKHGDSLREHTGEVARLLLRRLAEEQEEAGAARSSEVPDDVAIALMLSVPLDLFDDLAGLQHLLQWLPWLVRADAADFYVPKVWVGRRAPWRREDGLRLVEPRLERSRLHRPAPARREVEPGRNEPCPCGSGKKYKRCCGAAPATATES